MDRMPHSITMSLLFLSLQTAIGGIIWSGGVGSGSWKRYIEVIFHLHGIYSCRLSTAILAIALLLICSGHEKLVEKWKIFLILAGPLIAGMAVTILSTTSSLAENYGEDLMLAFGETQDYVNIGVLSVSMMVTLGCLIQKHRVELKNTEESDEEAPKK